MWPCRRGEKMIAADRHQHEADDALKAHGDGEEVDPAPARAPRRPRGRAWALRHSCAASSLVFRRRQHLVLVGAAGEFRDRPAAPQHHDPVAQAEQFRHFARGDENAEPLSGELANAGVDLALCADVDAARRLVEQQEPRVRRAPPWRARPSADCRPTARRPEPPAGPGARRTSGSPSRASSPSRAGDIRKNGETLRSTVSTRLRPTLSRSMSPLPRRSSVTRPRPSARAPRIEARRAGAPSISTTPDQRPGPAAP